MPAGRPSDYTPEKADAICILLAEGQGLRTICASEGMPDPTTVYRWLEKNEEFRKQYARARELQAETMADEILVIANTPVLGVKTKTNDDGVETIEGDMIDHRRLQVDARKWLASKLAPKKYGELVKNEHSGPNGGPIEATVTRIERVVTRAGENAANPDSGGVPPLPGPGSV